MVCLGSIRAEEVALTILVVEFVGEEYRISRGSSFTFGRRGDLRLDTAPELPAIVGRFDHDRDLWWLTNHTRALRLKVLDQSSSSIIEAAPESRMPIAFVDFLVAFESGRSPYELTLRVDELPICPPSHLPARPAVRLNREQRMLLAVMAETVLLGGSGQNLPSNAAVADRLGWTITKLNRKLDHLCAKFEKLGVTGLRGSGQRLATRRRQALVGFCVSADVITVDDLKLLLDLNEPPPRGLK